MRILRKLHTFYGALMFGLLFIVVFPFLLIPIIFPSAFRFTGVINRWWARLLYFAIFIPFKTEYRSKLDPKKQYIFCPNHFSYLDIPAMGLNHHNTIFVGKQEMEKVPLFGFMYSKLHITVNRSNLKSKANSLKRSLEAIDEGKSLVIYPEGAIVTEREPVMGRFKDGAFRVSIEKQIPIVPVTIVYNWIILPADDFVLHWHPLKVVFHEPIEPNGITMNEIDQLKEKTRLVIETELKKYVPHGNPSRVVGQDSSPLTS
jgi:1-acyl-sn-glycerol-3-phosphate acyltransferase